MSNAVALITDRPIHAQQVARAKEIKARLYGGKDVEKSRIFALTQEVLRLKKLLSESAVLADDAAQIEIRELKTALEDMQDRHSQLVVILKQNGLYRFVENWECEMADSRPVLTAVQIIHAVTVVSNIPTTERHSIRRQAHLVFWRSVEAWLMRKYTRRSYPSIGKITGGRDHSTILHAIRKVDEDFDTYKAAVEKVEELL